MVIGLLGRGGMGAVYKVVSPVIRRIMALKLLAPQPALVSLLGREEIKRRFIGEAMTMGKMRHPGVAAVLDFEDNGQTYMVMEYYCHNLGEVIGESYDLDAPSRVLTPDKAVRYVSQTLSGLHRLHQAGIIHRDIKPFNLLLTDEDSVKITDFGLSLLRGETTVSEDRIKVGSPYYAAPEQVKTPDRAGPPADLYSVGVMLFRLLTGRLPQEPGKIESPEGTDLAPEWRDFLNRSTDPDPYKRYQSADTMKRDLDELYRTWRERLSQVCRFSRSAPIPAQRPAQTRRLRSEPCKVTPGLAEDFFRIDRLGRPLIHHARKLHPLDGHLVSDPGTGLVWASSASDFSVTREEAVNYVEELNRKKWSGLNGWRLPTVDELVSLLYPAAENYCLDTVFEDRADWLWSADRRSAVAGWCVNAELGFVGRVDFTCQCRVRPVRTSGN